MSESRQYRPTETSDEQGASAKSVPGLQLLSGEHVITDLHHGLLQRGLDITSGNNITLTNRRLVVRYAKLWSEAQQYTVELQNVTAVTMKIKSPVPAAINAFIILAVCTASVAALENVLGAVLLGTMAIVVSALVFIFGKSVGLQISIPGFRGTNIAQGNGAFRLLSLVFPFAVGQKFQGEGLFFAMQRGVNTAKLQEFVDEIWRQKQLLKQGAAADARPAVPQPPVGVAQKVPRERLDEIREMLEEGLISKEEYEKQRQRILGDL